MADWGGGSFFPVFIVIIIGLGLWSAYELNGFTRPEGKLKRGVKIGSAPLAWEMCQLLETLPHLTRFNRNFILIEGREVLIAAEHSLWQPSSYRRRARRIPFVGYVDLSAPEIRLEFRLPLSSLVIFIVISLVVLFFLTNFFRVFKEGLFGFSWLWLFPVVFLVVYVGGLWLNYSRERNRLLHILDQALGQRSM
ncbi:MAG: hypothetical protein JW953_14365 [Anaerolineae bacterium]|nr:hypothetical protein [Anaerolineae bacterium]